METGKYLKSIEQKMVLESGGEITYYELGKENKEVAIMGEFYFQTFWPLVEGFAKKYHIYAICLRADGAGLNRLAADGEIIWPDCWADDIYGFCKQKGIKKFTYIGKCHGSTPGWSILYEHPEMLTAFACISLMPLSRIPQPLDPERAELIRLNMYDKAAFVQHMVRKPESVEKKLAEMNSFAGGNERVMKSKHRMPLEHIKTDEELYEFFKNIKTPMLLMYGTDDAGYTKNIGMYLQMTMLIKGLKSVLYQGEKHFFELDIPEKIIGDVLLWAEQAEKYPD
jgi:pimeloyl-ACP methyl ester carboxylesterase